MCHFDIWSYNTVDVINMTYELVSEDHPLLKTKLEPFVFNKSIDPEKFVEDLMAVMEKQDGIGLAANQVGINARIFVCHGDPYAVFNPRIVDTSTENILLDEGCLTYPGLYVKIKRPKSIRLRFDNYKGETSTQKYTGLTARIIQHEMDHLDGIIFYTRASKFHRDQAFRKYKAFQAHPERFKITKREIFI